MGSNRGGGSRATFYASRRHLLSLFFGTGILAFPVGLGFIATGRIWAIGMGAVILIGANIPVYVRATRAVLWIDESGARVGATTAFGRSRSVGPVSELALVISRDFLAFRKDGIDKIIIDRKAFSGSWNEVVETLQQYAFTEIIASPQAQ